MNHSTTALTVISYAQGSDRLWSAPFYYNKIVVTWKLLIRDGERGLSPSPVPALPSLCIIVIIANYNTIGFVGIQFSTED